MSIYTSIYTVYKHIQSNLDNNSKLEAPKKIFEWSRARITEKFKIIFIAKKCSESSLKKFLGNSFFAEFN